ncbi:MAG: ATP-binding protein, partial [Chloroflexota bacterium]|nr:ATP-binding protein [Chloroflexota bacterium]
MKPLKISKTLSLPLDVVTQTLAAVARKGAGKTYFATLLAELMRRASAQVIAIDIVGNWYGLRLGPGGRGKGVDIYVFGGEHGDLPLTPDAGPRIARLLVERPISAVLDISAFRKAERLRFAAQFAEEFFHLKKTQRSPVHVFVEEAQKLIPQVVRGESAAMVGAWEDIVRLGRNYGIGCTLVTQRPQSVNKEVLSQVECLVALQVNGVHERKALEEWVQEKGADRALVGELPGLAVGEAYVWSPSWLRIFERVKIATKGTYDASATPEVGKRRRTVKLSHADVAALKAELAEVVTRAEQDDPSALKRRIAELERALAQKLPAKPVVHLREPKTIKVETLVLREREAKRLEKVVARASKIVEQAHAVADSVAELVAASVE